MVQLEYHVGAELSIEYLKIWSSTTRGYLSLVCDYAVAAHRPNGAGVRFSNGFHSRDLGRFLDSILMNQNRFTHAYAPNTNATLEIQTPSAEDTLLANERVNEAFPRPAKAPAVLLATKTAV